MSVGLYDKALVDKIKNWCGDTHLTILTVEDTNTLWQVVADQQNDKPIQLPLLAIRRLDGFQINQIAKRPLSFDGLSLDSTIERTIQLNAIPITINYQIDVYTRYFNECDQLMRNLVFNFINSPILSIHIPYRDLDLKHNSKITLASEIQDNSNIPERLIPGQFTRFTLNLTVDDAYLFDARLRDNIYIDANVILAER